MKKTICWIAAVTTLLSSASAVDRKQRPHGSNRSATTYREGSRVRRSEYDPTKLPASNQSSGKELTQLEKQINRAPRAQTRKTATPKRSMVPQKGPRAERNVPMNFQYRGSKQTAGPTRARGKATGRRVH
ncbi:MAG: hypothetical protein DMG68_07905 [Acidobacteria bacterium]|jgi:hypothetical protein|nr:MAG: hypothetical protein DMG68_07905 [Acidobacteriota bacterium]